MKNKLIKIFALDLSYFLILLAVLIFTRAKIFDLLLKIQSYSPQLNAIDPSQNISAAQALINEINYISNQAYWFIFIIIPVIIFVIYIFLQGYSFYLLKKEKNYLLKFSLASLPSFIFFALFLFKPSIILFIISILAFYLTFFLHFKDLNKIKLLITKLYKFFPLFLIYLILSLAIIVLFYITYLTSQVGGNYHLLFIISLLFALLFSYYKIILVEKLFN